MSDPELSELLRRYFSAELDEAGVALLLERCRRDPAAARALAELTRVERALAWRHAGRGGETFVNEVLMRLGPERGKASGFVRAVLDRVRPASPRRWIAVAAAAVLLAVLGAAALWRIGEGPRPLDARVVEARGEADLLRRGGRLEARDGLDLVEGDALRTGADGLCEVRYGEGTRVRLFAGTEARFARDREGQRVELKTGSLRCDAAPQAPGRRFAVATPHAEAAVVGTLFEISASRTETRLHTLQGAVRFAAGGRSVEVRDGALSTADARGLRSWEPVCDLDFPAMRSLPAEMEAVFCPTSALHTPSRRVVPAPDRVVLEPRGLGFVNRPGDEKNHGLVVARLREEVGDDAVVEATIAGGAPWTLGLSVAGDSFEGYRAIFVATAENSGITVDSIWPVEVAVLSRSDQSISYDRDRTLRLEKSGRRIRVWVDGDLRIDAEVSYPLSEKRRKTAALSNFGGPPTVRSLRVWKRPAP